jgi:acetoin utilization protein AcuB
MEEKMLVKEVMSPHPVVIDPDMPVIEAERLMKEKNIRHLPVVHEGKGLVGLVTRETLSRALPSEMTTLTIWELNYQLSRIKVREVMVKKVISVTEDATAEKAARIMIDNKIGSLPVMRDGTLVGIVTDIDLLQALADLMGWRQPGVRVTVQVPDEKGRLAAAATAIAQAGGLLLGSGSYPADEPLKANIVFKVRNVPLDDLVGVLEGLADLEILDVREA